MHSSFHADSDAVTTTLTIVQRIWGWGNLTPLDDVFGSAAIVRLALSRASKFGLVARHFGNRLQRFSKEAGLWVDAFETETRHPALQKEKNIKCTLKAWTRDESLLGAAKFTEVAMFDAARIGDMPLLFRQCANGLKGGGKLFLADLMLPREEPALSSVPSLEHVRTKRDHEKALLAAGLKFQEEIDFTRDVTAKIRQGMMAVSEMLVEARKLDEPHKKLTRIALGSEIETWARIAVLLDSGKLAVTGILAIKP